MTACAALPKDQTNAAVPQAVQIPADMVHNRWWTQYNDPQLNALLEDACKDAPNLSAAAARLLKARALEDSQRASLYPTATALGATLQMGGNNPAIDSITLGGINFGWELDFWGKNRAGVKAATSAADAARADAHQAVLVLTTATVNAYFELAHLYKDYDLAQRALIIRQDSEALVSQKAAGGLTSKAELELARAAVANARGELAAIEERITIQRHLIAALAGQAPAYGERLERPNLPDARAFKAPERLDLELISRRPDVAAARMRVESASASTKRAKASFYPNINLMAFAGKVFLNDLSGSGMDAINAGPVLSLPLFEGGKLKANLRGAEADQSVALASYNQTVVTAMQEVADIGASQRALSERLQHSNAALAASEEAYRLARLRYEGGLSDYATLLLAEQNLLTQRSTNNALQSRALTLEVAMVKALGGPY
ncbi:efflux transporter outer membrane subunit [Asticcacaulis sp. BYS171W]|uniref:Efflux transporter outer membrane subunit n=1 Tax=Asticcacaulis aquaticus TaxID=2984212 RepID=A0ABT5HTK5_9CAUL|nr:efflux transporter outer membrane subunit [Asticcacaulis aquaticus]MDC7683369.1 efflux transporter outer membrane subunit [Asticcacaulis aquaticus]